MSAEPHVIFTPDEWEWLAQRELSLTPPVSGAWDRQATRREMAWYLLAIITAAVLGFVTAGWSWYGDTATPPCTTRWFEDGSGLRTCGDVITPIPNDPITDGPRQG